jgi:hypothetical protein
VAGYNSLSAVINAAYARAKGYEYIYVRTLFNVSNVPAASLRAKTACAVEGYSEEKLAQALEDNASPGKDSVSAFHPGNGALRASPWTRLLALWALGPAYERMLYLDSDVFVFRHVDFEEELSSSPLSWGHSGASASFVIGANRPFTWHPELPCTGVFLFRPQPPGRDLARRWWDTRGWERNHAYEQDALWNVMQNAYAQAKCKRKGGPLLDRDTLAVADVPQFPHRNGSSLWFENASWAYHTQEGWDGSRVDVMRRHLGKIGLGAPMAFAAAVERIRRHSVRELDVIKVALDMHEDSCREGC